MSNTEGHWFTLQKAKPLGKVPRNLWGINHRSGDIFYFHSFIFKSFNDCHAVELFFFQSLIYLQSFYIKLPFSEVKKYSMGFWRIHLYYFCSSCVWMLLYPTDSWSSVKKTGGILGAPSLPNWTCSRGRTYSKVWANSAPLPQVWLGQGGPEGGQCWGRR